MPLFKLDRARKRAIVTQNDLGLSPKEISPQFGVSVQTIRAVLKIHKEDEFAYTVCLQCGAEPEKDHEIHCANEKCLVDWLKCRCRKYNLKKYLKTKDGIQTIEIPKNDFPKYIRLIAGMDILIAQGGLSCQNGKIADNLTLLS